MKKTSLYINSEIYQIFIYRSRRKSIKMILTEPFTVRLDVPLLLSEAKIRSFLNLNTKWMIRQNQKYLHAIQLDSILPEYEVNLRRELKSLAKAFYQQFPNARFGYKPERIQVRMQKTRWGSCSSRGTISLNVYLMLLPEELRNYVLYHELCHLKHPHHQKSFWNELERLCPGSKLFEKELKRYRIPL